LISFRGPAPLHHTLLAGQTTTGVTVQTLHSKHFDHGAIISQTPAPGFDIPNPESCTVPELVDFVAPKGAQMLVESIEKGLYVPPIETVGTEHTGELKHAPKIKPEDRHIHWADWTLADINRRNRVIGPLWSKALCASNPVDGPLSFQQKRVIFTDIEEVDPPKGCDSFSILPGLPFTNAPHPVEPKKSRQLYVFTADGKVLRINRMKVEGEQDAEGLRAAIKARMFGDRAFQYEGLELTPFRNSLV
jgi:methionyl-tRNA formyltransferase